MLQSLWDEYDEKLKKTLSKIDDEYKQNSINTINNLKVGTILLDELEESLASCILENDRDISYAYKF